MASQYIGQHLKQQQSLVITPQLQQAIKLLQMNRMELSQVLQEELLENFCLDQEDSEETSIDTREEYEDGLQELPSIDQQKDDAIPEGFEDIDWEAYFQDMEFSTSTTAFFRESHDPDMPSFERRLKAEETLQEHLIQQVSLLRLDNDVREMCAYLVGSLNEEGWLVSEDKKQTDPLIDIAKQVAEQERSVRSKENLFGESLEESIEYWYEIAEEALTALQSLEPVGIGARNVQEGLLLQIRQKEEGPQKTLLMRLVEHYLPQLERRNYAAIAKALNLSLQSLVEAAEQLSTMDPRPGRLFQEETAMVVRPDIYVNKVNGQYDISIEDDGLPKLRINQIYKKVIKDKAQSKEEKNFIQKKLSEATWLLRSIHKRQQTIYKVTQSIVNRQRDFFEKGIAYLKPMVLRDVAEDEDVQLHESTISRVTTNKYVHTPQGVYELKFFFTSSLQSSHGGEDISSLTVKDKIQKMLAEEDPKKPLSDQKIVDILKYEGIQIARRTVAKYRMALNIPSSSKRKQLF